MKYSNQIHTAAQETAPLQLPSENDSIISLMVGIIWEIDRNTKCPTAAAATLPKSYH